MKKRIIFVLIAVLAVSFASTGFAAKKKAAKAAVTKKDGPVVLIKGLQLSMCKKIVKDGGTVYIPGLNDVTIPVKNGKFDLIVPSNPVFGDEEGLQMQSRYQRATMAFGTAKVYLIRMVDFQNIKGGRYADGVEGSAFFPFKILYSDSDVKGTITEKNLNDDDHTTVDVTLKKGWNILGDKKDLKVIITCQ